MHRCAGAPDRPAIGAVVAVVALLSVVAATGAQAQEPPPFGGFDTSVCHGRAARASVNGRLIVRKRGDRQSLYSVRVDGSGLRRVTRPPRGYGDLFPAAAPDGRRISFLREAGNADAAPIRVIVHDLVTGREHEVLPHASDPFHAPPIGRPTDFSPTWSPDGRWIAISALNFPGTVLVHPDGTGARPLDTGQWLLQRITWSPNGRCVVGMASWRRGPLVHFDGGGYAVVGAGGGRPNLFVPQFCPGLFCTRAEGSVIVTHWSLDGRGLIDALSVTDKPHAGEFDDVHLFRMGLSGAGGRLIARHLSYPVPSPDGRLVSGITRTGGSSIVTLRAGRRVRRLPRMAVLAWTPRRR